MEKSPDAFRTISEVADHLDTPAHVLRFWESRFPQIKPVKRAGGRRYYRPADVALLAGIRHLLHDEGLTIRGVQKILREQGVRHVASLSGQTTDDAVDAVIDLQGGDAFDKLQPPIVAEPAEVIPLAAWSGPQSPPAEDARTEAFLPDPLWQATPPVGEATEPVSPPPATEPLPPAEMAPLTEVPAEPSEPVAEAPKPWVAAPRPVQVELDFGFAAPPAPDPAESVLVIEPEAVEQAPAAESSPPATAPEPPEPPLVWLPAGLRALPASALTDRAEALRPLAMRLVALRSRLQEAHRQSRS
jgi:DNA-binding transcriptional MerR regulator